MKLYKKAAACLLTAAMAISMLTACGGGGTPDIPDKPGKPGSNTPSTLPKPDEIVLPDTNEGGNEGTDAKPTKTPIADVNNSKLAQFNKKYTRATECYFEMMVQTYDFDGNLQNSTQTRMARKNDSLYVDMTVSRSNQKQQSAEILTLKEGNLYNMYLLLRSSKVNVKLDTLDADDDTSPDTGLTAQLPDQMWSTKMKVGPTEYYAEIYLDGNLQNTICYTANGDPVYLFVKNLSNGKLNAAYLYKTIQAGSGTSKGLCALPIGSKTYSVNDEGTCLFDANGNQFTLIPQSNSEGTTTSFKILDKDGNDVTDNFKWVNDFYKMVSGQ